VATKLLDLLVRLLGATIDYIDTVPNTDNPWRRFIYNLARLGAIAALFGTIIMVIGWALAFIMPFLAWVFSTSVVTQAIGVIAILLLVAGFMTLRQCFDSSS
jgi:uncharacterized membrane protein